MLILLGLICATAATTMTLARAKVFAAWRTWVSDRNDLLGDLVNCTYCTSHWVASFYAVLGTRSIMAWLHTPWLDTWLVLSMTLVALSSPIQWLIYQSHKAIRKEG